MRYRYIKENLKFFGDWGLGIGDWGVGGWGRGPKPQPPTPKPPKKKKKYIFFF